MLDRSLRTIAEQIGARDAWRRGRSTYGLWLIGLDAPAVHSRVAAARKHLSLYLQQSYDRQPHITLFVCGFVGSSTACDDDYGSGRFEEHQKILASSGIAAFPLELNRLRSFASAPFFEVLDPSQGLARLRALLSATMPETGRDGSPYTPHVTVGLYSSAHPAGAVLDRIDSFPAEPLTVVADRIAFATYDARIAAGRLTMVQEVLLSGPV